MLPRNERLGTTDFAQAFAQSRTFHHALLQMRVHRRQGESCQASEAQRARVAFVVAKKLGRATMRNRIRRRLREAYRLSHGRNFPALHNLDIIFMVKAGALEAQSSELGAAVDELLMRLSQGSLSRSHLIRGEKKAASTPMDEKIDQSETVSNS